MRKRPIVNNHVHYCNEKCVLVVNPAGELKLVYIPFRVSQVADNGKRRVFIVDEVRSTKEDKLVYIINGNAFYHSHFTIDVQF